jgi:hypothetical protein
MTKRRPLRPRRQPIDGAGRFMRTPAGIERDLLATEMRNAGGRENTWEKISERLGYGSGSNVRRAVIDVLAARFAEAEETIRQLRAKHMAELEMGKDAVWQVLDRHHITVNNGKVIYVGGEPLLDDGPVLAAVDRLNSIIDRQAKLTGTYAAQKIDAQVTTVSDADRDFQAHIAEQKAARAAAREALSNDLPDPAEPDGGTAAADDPGPL